MQQRLNYFEISMPLSKKLIELGQLAKKSSLGATIMNLVDIRASQINGCGFCLDMHVKQAKIQGERELRLYHVSTWRESQLFTPKERAALEWTEAVTKITDHGISDEVFERVKEHIPENELSELTFLIGVINTWNRLNVSFRQVPGSMDAMMGLTQAGLK